MAADVFVKNSTEGIVPADPDEADSYIDYSAYVVEVHTLETLLNQALLGEISSNIRRISYVLGSFPLRVNVILEQESEEDRDAIENFVKKVSILSNGSIEVDVDVQITTETLYSPEYPEMAIFWYRDWHPIADEDDENYE